MTEIKHTPTPIIIQSGPIVVGEGWRKDFSYLKHGEQLAAFIAQACSAHESLVAYALCSEAFGYSDDEERKQNEALYKKHGWDGEEYIPVFIRKLRKAALAKLNTVQS